MWCTSNSEHFARWEQTENYQIIFTTTQTLYFYNSVLCSNSNHNSSAISFIRIHHIMIFLVLLGIIFWFIFLLILIFVNEPKSRKTGIRFVYCGFKPRVDMQRLTDIHIGLFNIFAICSQQFCFNRFSFVWYGVWIFFLRSLVPICCQQTALRILSLLLFHSHLCTDSTL